MEKILFYNLNDLKNSKNIILKKHNMKRENICFNFRKNNYEKEHIFTGGYSNIIQDPIQKNKLYLVYRINLFINKIENQITGIAVSNNYGLSFKRPNINNFNIKNNKNNNVILQDFHCCHNFSLFYDHLNIVNNKLIYAIGGTHGGKPTKKPHILDKKNNIYIVPDRVWPKKRGNKNLPNPYITSKFRDNGLYLMSSDNKFNWTYLNNKNPIYHALYSSNTVEPGIIAFDTLPKILTDFKNKQFILYTRCNLKKDVRLIVYSVSKDLINWSSPNLVKFNPELNYNIDNIYFPGFFNYPNTNMFIGFLPYFKSIKPELITTYASTKLVLSKDGINWNYINDFFIRKNKTINNNKNTRYKYDIAGFIEYDNKFHIFFHENVYKMKNYIVRYSIRKDGFTSIYSKNGQFEIEIPKKEIYINYKVEKDGYIKIENTLLKNDHINKKVLLKSNKILVEIKNSHIFSISY